MSAAVAAPVRVADLPWQDQAEMMIARVVPPDGHCVTSQKVPGGMIQRPHANRAALARNWRDLPDAARRDTYFSPATFVVPCTHRDGRTADNVAALSALFFDLDVGPGKPYPTTRDAWDALKLAVSEGLPRPTVLLGSGGTTRGLHGYFTLEVPAAPADWLPVAHHLRAALDRLGVKYDPTVGLQPQQILRLPGSVNAKNGQGARLLDCNDLTYTLEGLSAALARIVPAPAVGAVGVRAVAGLAAPDRARPIDANAGIDLGAEFGPSDPAKVASRCAVLSFVRAKPAEVPEHLWHRAAGVFAHCAEGGDYFHEISEPHPSYTRRETDAKLARAAQVGPTTCTELGARAKDTAGCPTCDGCKYQGRITSPIQLGRDAPAPTPAAPVSVAEVVAEVAAEVANAGTAPDEAAPVDPQHDTDMTLAGVFVGTVAGRLLFDHGAPGWRHHSGGRWLLCDRGEHREEFKKVSGGLMQLAGRHQTGGASDKAKTILKLGLRAQSAAGIANALKLAESDPQVAARSGDFDRDPDLLNVANGVVHLPTGHLRPHDPALKLSRQCPVQYDATAQAPRFAEFMRQVSCDDPSWVRYMQRVCGYAISGHVGEEVLFFWLGRGANGKSVLANVLRNILGTYAVVVPAAFLMQSRRDGGAATPELAMLAGARLALANEVEAGAKLSGQTVKVAVSTEAITARALYGAPFTFQPTHKLFVRANHKPIITDNDEGIWRRMDLVPFDLNLTAAQRDAGLEARLMAEAPGILTWMAEGFRHWRSEGGRNPCRRVADASRSYRTESDLLQGWVSDCCTVGRLLRAPKQAAYANYRGWCADQGVAPVSKPSFTRGLVERGFTEARESTGQRFEVYQGLALGQVLQAPEPRE